MSKLKTKKKEKSKLSTFVPISLAVAGVLAAAVVTIYLLKNDDMVDDQDYDVENYDLKKQPVLFI